MVKSTRQSSNQITLTQHQIDQIKEIFDLFDTDGGGSIDRKELLVAMTALGFQDSDSGKQSKEQQHQEMLDTIDADGSDSVSLEEFTALMRGESTMVDPLEEVKAIFQALSSMEESDPSVITLNKLRLATQKFNVRFIEEELQVMMSQADLDGNSTVDEGDFISVMRHSPWF